VVSKKMDMPPLSPDDREKLQKRHVKQTAKAQALSESKRARQAAKARDKLITQVAKISALEGKAPAKESISAVLSQSPSKAEAGTAHSETSDKGAAIKAAEAAGTTSDSSSSSDSVSVSSDSSTHRRRSGKRPSRRAKRCWKLEAPLGLSVHHC